MRTRRARDRPRHHHRSLSPPHQLQEAHAERVDVHPVVVILFIQFGRHELGRAQHRLRRGARAEERREPQVADFHHPLGPVDEHVVALQVAVDDGRRVAVEVDEAAQDLPRPPFEHFDVDVLVPLAVLAQRAAGEQLRDEVDGLGAVVEPGVVERHDVAVFELFEDPDFGKKAVPLLARRLAHELRDPDLGGGRGGVGGSRGERCAARGVCRPLPLSDLVPRDFRPLLFVERFVNRLECAPAEDVVELKGRRGVAGSTPTRGGRRAAVGTPLKRARSAPAPTPPPNARSRPAGGGGQGRRPPGGPRQPPRRHAAV